MCAGAAIVYLDDVIVFSSSHEQHLVDLDRVLTLLGRAGVSLKFSKCSFFQSKVAYLGHIVSAAGFEVDQSKTAALRRCRAPTNRWELRSFLGLANVYRRFVPDFAKKARPLTLLLKKDGPELFELDEEQTNAFCVLKDLLCTAPVLALPKKGGRYVLDTDASGGQVGCVLQQEQEGELRPLGYWSKTLNAAEENYSTTEKEALAVVWSVRLLRPYLEREHFTVRTDHSALRWMYTTTDGNARVLRWRLALAEFDFTVEYRPGRVNQAADAMSRLQIQDLHEGTPEIEVPVLIVHVPAGEWEEKEDLPPPVKPDQGPRVRITEDGLPLIRKEDLLVAQVDDDWCQEVWATRTEASDFIEEGGLLTRRSFNGFPNRILAPVSLRERILTLAHYPRIQGHPGGRRMSKTICRTWYWPQIARDCALFVKRCPSCQAARLKYEPKRTVPMCIFPPAGPLEFIAMDILGPLPKTSQGNRYVLVIVDRFSKLVRTISLTSVDAVTVARAYVDGWIAIYGTPVVVLTDNGTQFRSKFMTCVNQLLGVKQAYTTSYHPSTNGQCERFNRELCTKIAHYAATQADWDLEIAIATKAYNDTVHSSTNFAPNELVLSRPSPPMALELDGDDYGNVVRGPAEYHHEFLSGVENYGKLCRETLERAQRRYKKAYDLHVRARNKEIEIGDMVAVRTFVHDPGRSPKIEFPVSGPFIVVGETKSGYKIRSREGIQVVHSNRVIKLPHASELPMGIEGTKLIRDPENSTGLEDPKGEQEYVVDKIVDHGVDGEGIMRVKVRWYGFTEKEDTWEPVTNLPRHFLRLYARRQKIPLPIITGISRVATNDENA